MSENGEIYTAGKNFTLPPALTAWTNSTSDPQIDLQRKLIFIFMLILTKNFTLIPLVKLKH